MSDFDEARTVHVPTPVEISLGGRRYPWRHAKGCKVCNCESRFEIEEQLLIGRSYASILRGLPDQYCEGGPLALNVQNLKDHVKNHMPVDVTVSRAVIEQRAEEVGRALETMEGTIIDAYSVASEVMRLGFERVMKGEIKVGLDHTILATKMVADMDEKAAENSSVDSAVYVQLVTLLLQHVRSVMTSEQFNDLSSAFRTDPVFSALASQIRGEIES